MADHFDEAVKFAAKKLGLPNLKSQQTNALRQFVLGHDLFVNLPTGFGKSVIFQAAPIILDFLSEKRSESVKAVVIVVLPLKALVVDQLDRVRKIWLKIETVDLFLPYICIQKWLWYVQSGYLIWKWFFIYKCGFLI